MPLLANYCRKNSPRCRGDNGAERICCCDQNKSENELAVSCTPNYSAEEKSKCKYEGVGIVKTLLGPSLEDAVLKTLKFGQSLIQNSDENESVCNSKTVQKQAKRSCKDRCKHQTEHGRKTHYCGTKNHSDCRQGKKRIIFSAEMDQNFPLVRKSPKKLSHLSKIRSLDSDLKTTPHSPEKIKKQLEALIQINKDEASNHAHNWNIFTKIPPVPMEMTVMPSVCIYKNDADLNSSSCDGPSVERSSCDQSSSQRRCRTRLGAPSGICQAPEFFSNALGPTLDVSIIDNLKMMRDIFKTGENGRGEGGTVCIGGSKRSSCVSFVDSGSSKHGSCRQRSSTSPVRSKASQSQDSLKCKIQEAEKTIEELQQQNCCLQKQIEQEEEERAYERMAFEEEKRKICEMKGQVQNMARQERKMRENSTQKSQCDINYEGKYEALRQRIAYEEEKLSRLKDQYECYRRELTIARSRCEAVRRNKCILDAWDVIASRVCHTRLPSFTRAYALERKELKVNDSVGNMHCCFPAPLSTTDGCALTPRKSRSQTQCKKDSCTNASRSKESCGSECGSSGKACILAQGEIPFPVQRDVTCGLHQTLRTCCCRTTGKGDLVTCSSDDELLKKCGAQKPCKPTCRSKSDTSMRKENNSKIVKVLWAVTRINIFQDNCRTYEVMDATTTPPPCIPAKTEGIFVVKSSQKKKCPDSGAKKKCTINFSKK